MVNSRVPLKIILFGEYGVLSGGTAIAFAINRYAKLTKSNDQRLIVLDKHNNEYDISDVLPEYVNNRINIEAEVGSCLGTSAAVSLLLSYSKNHQKSKLMVDEAIEIENAFHGKSSGLDVYTCFSGGVVQFKSGIVKSLNIDFSRFKIMIWYSGIKKSTKNSISNAKTQLFDEISAVAEEALSVLQTKFEIKEIYKLIRKAQNLLDKLGVCPDKMKSKILEMREKNIESKITGSGNGGYLITLINKDQDLEGWEEVKIDYEGFIE